MLCVFYASPCRIFHVLLCLTLLLPPPHHEHTYYGHHPHVPAFFVDAYLYTMWLVWSAWYVMSVVAHIDQMMSKLNTVCFVIQTIQVMMSQETLRMVYFAYVHSFMSYGIIFGGTNHIMRKFSKFKRGWSELLQIQELETHVGNCLKNWKYCPYIHNIFFLYQYLW